MTFPRDIFRQSLQLEANENGRLLSFAEKTGGQRLRMSGLLRLPDYKLCVIDICSAVRCLYDAYRYRGSGGAVRD